MSEKPETREESPRQEEKKPLKETGAREKAKAAIEERSKKSSDALYYWIVIGGFIVMCIACIFYVFKEWRQSPNLVPAVSHSDIDLHNSRSTAFKRGPNALFAVPFFLDSTLITINLIHNRIFRWMMPSICSRATSRTTTRISITAPHVKTKLPSFLKPTTSEPCIRSVRDP